MSATPSDVGPDGPTGRTFASNAAVLFVVGACSQLFTLAGLVFLARIFKPEHFGALATIVSLGAILATIASGRFDLGIVVDTLEVRAARYVELVTGLSLVSAVFIALCWVAAVLFGMTTNLTPSLITGMWFLPAIVLANGFNLAMVGCAIRERRYGMIAASQFVNAACTLVAQLLMAILVPLNIALPMGYVCGQVSALALLTPLTWTFLRSIEHEKTIAGLWDLAVDGRTYPFHVTPYSFIGQLYAQVPQLLVTYFFGMSVSGQYSNAVRISFAPMTLLPSAIGQVLFGEMARSPKDKAWGRRIAATTTATGVFLSFYVAALVSAGPELMTVVLGPQWRLSGHISQVVVVGSLAVALVAGHDRVFDVFGLQRLRLLLTMTNTLVLAAVLAGVGAAHASLTIFMLTLITVQSVASFSWGIFALRSANFPIKPWLKGLSHTMLAVLVWLFVFEEVNLASLVPMIAKFVSNATVGDI